VIRLNLIRALFVASVAAYPFLVYFGLQFMPPSAFGLALLVLLALRYGVLLPSERPILVPMLLIFVTYALTATLSGGRLMLLYYPAVVNLTLCGVFLNSLRQGDPLLLRIVRARGLPVSEHGPKYLYRLTGVWAAFFALNALISIWTSTQTIEVWTLYNGFLSYCLVALLFGVEYVFRHFYKRQMGIKNP
jgi:uncharacterized membrane protein